MTKRFCERCKKMVPFGVHACVPVAKALASTPVKDTVPVSHGPTHAPSPTHGITHNPTHKSSLRKAQTYRWRERYPDRRTQVHEPFMSVRPQIGVAISKKPICSLTP
jgi:hypothetical protein